MGRAQSRRQRSGLGPSSLCGNVRGAELCLSRRLDAIPCGSEDTAMLKLSAFADEISPDLEQQIQTCKENSVTHFELRGVDGKNVMDFDDALKARIKKRLTESGL